MICGYCDKDADVCLAHCQKAADGAHVPDVSTVQYATDDILDIWCSLCGNSGSVVVLLSDIAWQ
jgi:hypothetical protein